MAKLMVNTSQNCCSTIKCCGFSPDFRHRQGLARPLYWKHPSLQGALHGGSGGGSSRSENGGFTMIHPRKWMKMMGE